jgi:hypothetical protein
MARRCNRNRSRRIIISKRLASAVAREWWCERDSARRLPESMTKPVTKIVSAALLMLWLAAFAIGGQTENRKLVMGSVYRIVKNLIEVKEEEGDIAVVHVHAATSFVNSSTQAHAKLKDISVGDQVAIKVVVKSGVDTAEQVKFVPALGSSK